MIRTGVVSAVNAASEKKTLDNNQPAILHPVCPSGQMSRNVQVQLDPLSGCGACSASGGCGVQLLALPPAPLLIDCQLPEGVVLNVGDPVQVALAAPGDGWLPIVVKAYGMPTVGMIIGTLAGYWTALALHVPQSAEGLSLTGFVIGLAGGLIAWSRAEKSAPMRQHDENRFQIHKVIQER